MRKSAVRDIVEETGHFCKPFSTDLQKPSGLPLQPAGEGGGQGGELGDAQGLPPHVFGQASLRQDGTQLIIGSDNIVVAFVKTDTPYELSGKLTTTWGLEVVFGGTFTLNNPEGVLLQRGSDLPADNRVLIATTLNGGTFSVDNKDLSNTYFYDGGVAGVSVRFALDNSDEEADFGTASVSGTMLSWGSYKGLELPIVVTLEDNNGVVFDMQEFTAYIVDPIKDTEITTREGSIGATTSEQSLYISTLLTLYIVPAIYSYVSTNRIRRTKKKEKVS